MQQLAGKVAVVTGGASGIGLAIAKRLAAEQVKLAILDVEPTALANAERELRDAGATVLAIEADVGSAASLDAAASRVIAELGIAHVIVNNAGVAGPTGPTWTLGETDWAWTLHVNLWGVINGIRAFVPPLLASGEEGHVVNTASIAGLTTHPWMGPYCATKHAVVAISEVLAKEFELARAKVGVSVLCPGFVNTNISNSERNRPAQHARTGPRGPDLTQVMNSLVAAGISPSTIAEHVVAAIREPRFYILTHPELRGALEHRQRDILDGRPPGMDPMWRELLGKR
jgi:NAD(P)-dependent dehydrogenase (short-subunit alcohol dehydrogenase family)